jgi:hypothetical protein
MREFTDLIEVIKDIISKECGERKVLDKDVAKALCMTQASFATSKSRSKIPFLKTIEFAERKKLDLNYLLQEVSYV